MLGHRVPLVVLAGALVVAACNGGDDTKTSSRTTTSSGNASDRKDSPTKCDGCPRYGKSDTAITASQGDEFVIEFESNPTTGYEWTATSSDPTVVEVVADEYVKPSGDALGAPGTQRFLLDPVASGSATVQLRYARSFQADDPDVQELTYTVTVS
jgi:predicted secreted protein